MNKHRLFINISKTAAFLLIAALVLSGIYEVLRWKDTTGDYLSCLDELYNTDEGLIDVVFVGSSHSYAGIYPAVLWEEYGISSFNLAVSGQDRDSAYHALVELLKTQDPEVVFVDLYALTFEKHAMIGNVYRNLLSLHSSRNSAELVMDYVDAQEWEDYILRWPIIHTRYRELAQEDFIPYEINAFGRGALYSWTYQAQAYELILDMLGESNTNPEGLSAKERLSEANLAWLEDMIALSESEGFTLVFTILPYVLSEGDRAIYDAVIDYCDEIGIDVLDIMQLSSDGVLLEIAGAALDLAQDFSDSSHLSGFGAVKVSTYLGWYLQDFPLKDHRGDEAYWQWEEDDAWYVQSKFLYALEEAQDLEEYLSLLYSAQDLLAIISIEDGAMLDEQALSAFFAIGISAQDALAGGKWLLSGSVLTKVLENDTASLEYILDLGPSDTLRLCYEGDFAEGNIMIGTTDYSHTDNAVQILVYDNIALEIAQDRSFY